MTEKSAHLTAITKKIFLRQLKKLCQATKSIASILV
jgi:hypothetical protein